MHDDAIASYVRAVLRSSGVPIERRADVQRELCDHILELAARRLPDESEAAALERALALFGTPDDVRRSLRRSQRALDWRVAFWATRRLAWFAICLSLPMAGFVAVIARGPGVLCAIGAGLLAGAALTLGIGVLMFVATLLEIDARRRRLRDEFSFVARAARWFGVLVVTLSAVVVGCAGLAISGYWLSRADPVLLAFPWHRYAVQDGVLAAELIAGILNAIALAGVAAFALAAYEWSRCVDSAPVN